MATTVRQQTINNKKIENLRMKAELFDEVVELIEQRYLGELMRESEKERNISLVRARPQSWPKSASRSLRRRRL